MENPSCFGYHAILAHFPSKNDVHYVVSNFPLLVVPHTLSSYYVLSLLSVINTNSTTFIFVLPTDYVHF
jgi:hypothetical protein